MWEKFKETFSCWDLVAVGIVLIVVWLASQ